MQSEAMIIKDGGQLPTKHEFNINFNVQIGEMSGKSQQVMIGNNNRLSVGGSDLQAVGKDMTDMDLVVTTDSREWQKRYDAFECNNIEVCTRQ